MCCLTAWFWLRQPYSPTQELLPVAITAFTTRAPSPEAGKALADAAAGWAGVTAATYNASSDLLVLVHQASVDAEDLNGRLQSLASQRIERKVFAEQAGPQCPVPQAMLARLPDWLLGAGLLAAAGFLWLQFRPFKAKQVLPLSP